MSDYVERRLARLQAATVANDETIAALAQRIADGIADADELALVTTQLADAERWKLRLAAELALLTGAPSDETTDEAAELAMLAWLSGPPNATPAAIVEAVALDPVTAVLGEAPVTTAQTAASVMQIVRTRRPGRGTIFFLRPAAGGDGGIDELVAVALRKRLEVPEADRPDLKRDVVVMLPLRLETLFESDGAAWTMLLRIIPDEASIRRDDPVPTPTEVTLLLAMWRETQAVLTPAEQALSPSDWLFRNLCPTAWEKFCSRVGPPRAAWLTGTFPPTVADGTITVDAPTAVAHPSPPNRVGGFPEEIEIWCGFGTSRPQQLATTVIDRNALVFDVIGGRAQADGTISEQGDRWWVSWPEAKRVGLGVEIVLPDGRTPSDITTLYAVGLSDEDPTEHFRGQILAGEMAYVSMGAPTNSVDGEQAASLAADAEDWRLVATQWLSGLFDWNLSGALTGNTDTLPTIPPRTDANDLDRTLVQGLWPALWGHHLRDIWNFGEDADGLAEWAAANLSPEGPLWPVRIADQPYGLLPVSTMHEWRVGGGEEGQAAACEERMLSPLLTLRDAMADAARARGNVVGADTARLLDLIGTDATSAGYLYRLFVPTELMAALYQVRVGFDAEQFAEEVRRVREPAEEALDQRAFRSYLAAGRANAMTMPLVVPTVWPEFFWVPGSSPPEPAMSREAGLASLFETLSHTDSFTYNFCVEMWRGVLPDSLLVRLLLYSGLLSAAGVVQTNNGVIEPLLEPLIDQSFTPTRLHTVAEAWNKNDPDDHPAGRVHRRHHDALRTLFTLFDGAPPNSPQALQLERAFRATLDTATHRVDPWLIGMTNRRLQMLAIHTDTRFRLGVYGWVDGPILGTPGPTDGGLLHAPSHAQALTAVILRDKSISERTADPGSPDPWSMQLESARIRLAEELAEEVRLGSHLYEVVGRQVERVVANAEGVRTLRRQFPLHAGQDEAGRVCSGVDALTALLSDVPPVTVTASRRSRLEALRDALDAYADLLVAEAVHQVVTGHADLAGAAMDAAAGLAAPPTLDFTRTPLGGDGLGTAVISAVPFVAPPVGAASDGASPALIADASVASAVEAATGAAASWTWSAGDTPAAVTLADLGLEPIDTLALSPDLLAAMAGFLLGAEPGELSGTGTAFQELARTLVRTLGTQPALASDIAATASAADPVVTALDAAMLAELNTRYAALRDEAQRTIDALAAAIDLDTTVAALRRSMRWGITPMVNRGEQQALFAALFQGVAPADPELLASLASRAADALAARLKAAPLKDDRVPLARSIAELAAPEGQLAVLGRIELDALRSVTGLQDGEDPELDENWLPVVSAVRPQLSKVEATQLQALLHPDALTGFTPVSNAPGDHWQMSALATLNASSMAPGGDPHASVPRFVAGYGTDGVWSGDAGAVVAVGLIDSWSETVPRASQTSTAAFGFNAPAARPPQAILIAVPPDITSTYGAPASTERLVQVLTDTRLMAHARAAHADDLGPLLAAVPTTMFAATPDTGVQFTGTSFG